MFLKVSLTGLLIIISIIFLFKFIKRKLSSQNKLITRFKSKFKKRERIFQRFSDKDSDLLMGDPEKDIKYGSWNTEHELRLKADIHRARLSKYGRSKMNGVFYFQGARGGVYKKSKGGTKRYI